MHLILSHIGLELPNHIEDCLLQTRKFYSGPITIVTNSINTDWVKKYNVNIEGINFENEKYKISQIVNFSTNPSREFWLYTLARLFFIEDFVVKNKIENFVLFDNDVLIFSDLNDIITKMSETFENISITMSCDLRATTGFAYFKSYKNLTILNNDIVELIKNFNGIIPEFGDYPSEMCFIRKISKTKDYISSLPIFPTDKFFENLNFVFDPASYGQFLGGSPFNNEPHVDLSTYIGKKINEGEFRVFFDKNDGPFLIKNEIEKFKIFNLHVWSKNLKKFL